MQVVSDVDTGELLAEPFSWSDDNQGRFKLSEALSLWKYRESIRLVKRDFSIQKFSSSCEEFSN